MGVVTKLEFQGDLSHRASPKLFRRVEVLNFGCQRPPKSVVIDRILKKFACGAIFGSLAPSPKFASGILKTFACNSTI